MADKKISLFPAATLPLSGGESLLGLQTGTTRQIPASAVAALAPVQDHGQLTGLGDDDHPQYHTDARGDARYIKSDRQIATSDGLTGGGDLSANRTFAPVIKANGGIVVTAGGFAVDIAGLNLLGEAIQPNLDLLMIYNASGGNIRSVSITDALSAGSGFVAIGRQIISGAGLTGGGDLSTDRTLSVGAGTGITVNADDIALNIASTRNTDHAAVSINAGSGLGGGGDLTATRTLSLDVANTRNVDHANVSITGVNSISGGGDITASRTLSLVNDVTNPGNDMRYGTTATGLKGWVPNSQAAVSQFNSLGVGVAASGLLGEIRATNDITAFFSSDAKFKDNVRPINDALAIIRCIRGVRFEWNEEWRKTHGEEDGYFNRRHDIGFIAQTVEPVVPEVVGKRVDGTLALKYDRLVAVCFEAIRQLEDRISLLENRNDASK